MQSWSRASTGLVAALLLGACEVFMAGTDDGAKAVEANEAGAPRGGRAPSDGAADGAPREGAAAGGSREGAAEGAPSDGALAERGAAPAELEGAVLERTASAWFRECMGLAHADATRYMNKRIVLTGTVTRVIDEVDGSHKVWLEGEGKGWISLQFADEGAAVEARGVTEGASLRATCTLGGVDPDRYVMMLECTLG